MAALYVFIAGLMFSASPFSSAATSLALGIFLSLVFSIKLPVLAQKNGKYVMQVAIVFLGFSMDPISVFKSGSESIGITAFTLLLSLGIGLLLAKLLKIKGTTGLLISAGTGICGGSAIASLSPVLNAKEDEVAVSMATVFCLNAIALFVFPKIGHLFEMTPAQFGWFAAIAIHDTSSVVGAATAFHPDSVAIAVTAKLTRALWIIPLVLLTAFVVTWKNNSNHTEGKKPKIQIPWFIGLFMLASLIHGLFPDQQDTYAQANAIGKTLLKIAIFIIGMQLTVRSLKAVGLNALAFGTLLWLILTGSTIYWLKLL
jgi:uncharacterized integral membrane protein (TIGR00698 family)